MRKEFDIAISFNGKQRKPLIIDSHFRKKHPDVTYEIIVDLVTSLDGGFFEPQQVVDGWSYFAIEPVFLANIPYRVVLVTSDDQKYLGVINAFRVSRKKYET